jgi:glucose/arabinose dehydrogenase
MPGVNVVVGNDGVNNLSGSAGNDLIYGFDPNGPQSNVNSIAATRVATGLSGALFATAAPEDSQRLFIVQQNGTVRVLDLDSGQLLPTPFITLPVDSAGERGLLGMTFDPDYATNGFVYFYQTVTTGGTHNEIVRYHVNPANPNVVDGTTPTTIINIGPLSAATNHNGGWIGFGPDGYLYAAVGDNANGDNAQTTTNLLGKILRIDVHNDAFPGDSTRNYAIPSDNMFAATAGADEIFALGLRNPFRDSFDRGTGEFFVADVGQSTWEEIDLGRSGANYGWPLFEGPAGSGTVGAGTLTGPIYSYNHSVGIAVIGGYAYRGTSEGLQGQYFFADLGSGHVSTLRFDGSAWVATDRTSQIHTDVGTISSPTSFGEDAKGNLYIVDLGGDVFRLTPNAVSADQGDTLRGFGGNDMMFGGSGDDLLDGGTGQDTMTGGPGADHFVFAPGYGRDIVNDFVTSGGVADRIDLTAFTGVYTLIDVLSHTTQVGADAVIDFGNGDTLRLLGVTKASLSWDDFSFGAAVQGDFGGNGHEDILWRRDDGSASIWDDGRIGGGHIISGAGVMGSSWHIAGTGDFDGNGRDDILWRNDNGAASIWDNAQIGSAHIISGAGDVPNDWHIV